MRASQEDYRRRQSWPAYGSRPTQHLVGQRRLRHLAVQRFDSRQERLQVHTPAFQGFLNANNDFLLTA
jgi:hypothetical protein